MQSDENCHKSILIIRGILAHSDTYKVLLYDRPCEQKDEDPFFFSNILIQSRIFFVKSSNLKFRNLSVSQVPSKKLINF